MAQFDVRRNKGALRYAIPFVVIVQSSLFNGYRRRMVVPLVLRTALPGGTSAVGSRLNPGFLIENIAVVLHPLDMVSVAIDQLGEHVASLADSSQSIADALDEVLTRSISRSQRLGQFFACCHADSPLHVVLLPPDSPTGSNLREVIGQHE